MEKQKVRSLCCTNLVFESLTIDANGFSHHSMSSFKVDKYIVTAKFKIVNKEGGEKKRKIFFVHIKMQTYAPSIKYIIFLKKLIVIMQLAKKKK